MSMNAGTSLRERLTRIFRVFSTPERVRALELIKEGKSLEEIAKLIGMSRTGLQRVLNDFQSLELIEPTGHRSYRKLTFRGEGTLELLGKIEKELENIEIEYRKNILKASMVKYGFGLTPQQIDKIVEEATRKIEDAKQ